MNLPNFPILLTKDFSLRILDHWTLLSQSEVTGKVERNQQQFAYKIIDDPRNE